MGGERYSLLMLIGLLTIAATIMIGGSSAMSAHGKEKTVEATSFPACSNEEIALSGIQRFTITEKTDKDGNVFVKVVAKILHVTAVGIASGTEYTWHEKGPDDPAGSRGYYF